MDQQEPTAPGSDTPALMDWGLAQQGHLPRLPPFVGKNVMDFLGWVVSPVGRIQPSAETVLLNGGLLVALANYQSAMLVRKHQNKLSVNSHLLPSGACSEDLLPSVTNAYYPYYSATELVVGTTATIECLEGYHFPGSPVAITTPVPPLYLHTTPVRCKHSFFALEYYIITFIIIFHDCLRGGEESQSNDDFY